MSRRWLLLTLCLILCAQSFGSGIQKDTARFAAHLERLRKSRSLVMTFEEYNPIQNEYLAWVDSRIRMGASAARMNAELASAHLFLDGRKPDVADMLDKSYAGFLGEIESKPAGPEGNLLAVTFGIHTSAACGFDETLVLYSERTRERIAWINAESLRADSPELRQALAEGRVMSGSHLRGFDVGRDDPGSGRFISSAWVLSNCSSNWNGESLRIDSLRGQTLANVLSESVVAFFGDPLRIRTEGHMITFTYTSNVNDGTAALRPAINRYRVQGGRALREPPMALSFGGFIDEWLKADDAEAARWSSPEAAKQHHALAARYQTEQIHWEHVSSCPGPPSAREIAVRWADSKQTNMFLIGTASAAEMRMLAIYDAPLSSCREIAGGGDRRSIMAEPAK